jgi:hypothetical protein
MFDLTASHPTGAGPRYNAHAESIAELISHIDAMRRYKPEMQILVVNTVHGFAHTYRPGEGFSTRYVTP